MNGILESKILILGVEIRKKMFLRVPRLEA